jgi:hypothetical protein
LRDSIDAAFEQHATDEVDEQPGAAAARARDDLGRFAPKEGQEPPATPPQGTPQPLEGTPAAALAPKPVPTAPAASEPKAPASWTPSAREKWAGLDPEVRGEVNRREQEAQRVLQDSAGLREFARSFQDIVRPYEMFIRSENSDPLRAVQSLMNTAGQLRVGSPATKVGIVASIIQQHGIDLTMLDDMLASQLGLGNGGAQQPARQQFQDPRVDQLLAMQQRRDYEAQQATQTREAEEARVMQEGLAHFASTHEFYNDVRDTMADLVDHATARGQPVDIEKIYARACQLDEQVSTILAQRGGAQPAARRGAPPTSPAVLRARRAAASVKGDTNPQGSTVPRNDSIRSAIEAAFDANVE